ncbi:hypothetical protein N7509_006271 [Penicillium cosmopolitanum]|uniref:Uncharacterized protein n=1 Tax=Penicillium cosmopolitanum TaxID=1131564 RepID=A0A9W9W443_9EURO|nr:uncharacterized protein N7509_006271 [Penicillium cosmopolitanum]KAJ5398158.1 hypothetical protein N7509_006271 [Penicillium cosmopolitanum]
MLYKTALSIACILVGTQAQQATNCQYQSLKCGSALLAAPYSYTTAQLIAAINDTASIPILTVAEISQTLFHCTDILGTITGNSYCFAGCDSKASTRNDQCSM